MIKAVNHKTLIIIFLFVILLASNRNQALGLIDEQIIPVGNSQTQDRLLNKVLDNTNRIIPTSIPPDLNQISSQSTENSISNQFTSIIDYENTSTIYPTSGEINVVAFSPVDLILASGNSMSTVDIWDIRTSTKLYTLVGHTGSVTAVEFSENGELIATGSADTTVKLWNVSTGTLIRTYSDHTFGIKVLDFSPDGTMLVSGSSSNIKIWNTASSLEIDAIPGGSYPTFSPDGEVIAAKMAGAINFYNASTRAVEATIPSAGSWPSFHPNGTVLATVFGTSIKFWNVTDQTEIATLSGFTSGFLRIVFSPDGTLISAGNVNTVKVWKTSSLTSYQNLTYHSNFVLSVSFSFDGRYLASGSADSTIKLLNLKVGSKTDPFSDFNNARSPLAFSPNAEMLASGYNASIRLWNASTGNEIRALPGHLDLVTSVDFNPDGSVLVSSSVDNTIRTWNVSTGVQMDVLVGHTSDVNQITFSPDGKLIASSSTDQTVKIWNVSTGTIVYTFTGHSNIVVPLDFSPDGRVLVSGSNDQTIKVWNVSSRTEITTLIGHSNTLRSLSIHPNGEILASSSSAGVIKLWNMTAYTEITELTGHTNDIPSIIFSSHGVLASTSYDATIRIWNVTSYSEIKNFNTESELFYYIDFSPDGTQLASAGFFTPILRIWTVGTFLFSFEDHRATTVLTNTTLKSSMSSVGAYYAGWDSSPLQKIVQKPTSPNSYGNHVLHIEAYHMGRKFTQDYHFLVVVDFNDYDGDSIPNLIEETIVGLDELDHSDAQEDLDSDGLSNLLEFVENTSFTNNDTDTDGMTDGYEYYNDLNPLQIDNSSDKDMDGLINILEFQLNSKANNSDSDSDGIEDEFEYIHNLLILVDDSSFDPDNDELSNLEEFQINTNPNNPDTDNDAWRDDLDPEPLVLNGPPTVTWADEIQQLSGQLTNKTNWDWSVNTTNAISIELWLNDISKGRQNSSFSWAISLSESSNNITTSAWYNYGYNYYSDMTIVTLNTTIPVVTLVSPQNNEYYQSRSGSVTSVTIDVEGYDGFIKYYWDIGSYETVTTLTFELPTTDGEHILYLKATNDIGNSKFIEFTFYTDNTDPTAEVSGISNDATLSGVVSITVNTDDLGGSGISHVTILRGLDLVDNKTTNFVFEWDTENIPNGNYEISIHIVDKAGNELVKNYSVIINNDPDSGIPDTALYAIIGVSVVVIGGGLIRFIRGRRFDKALDGLEDSFLVAEDVKDGKEET